MFNVVSVLYPGFEELDFAGPYEVFGAAALAAARDWRVTTVAGEASVQGCHGLVVQPEGPLSDAPPADVLIVPGGSVSSALEDRELIHYIGRAGKEARFVASVCTGAFLLHAAGLLEGKRATTHWAAKQRLRSLPGVTVVDARWVHDGKVVTAAGVSAGIDMALYLLGHLKNPEVARGVQLYMEYEPEPPYQEVSLPAGS